MKPGDKVQVNDELDPMNGWYGEVYSYQGMYLEVDFGRRGRYLFKEENLTEVKL